MTKRRIKEEKMEIVQVVGSHLGFLKFILGAILCILILIAGAPIFARLAISSRWPKRASY